MKCEDIFPLKSRENDVSLLMSPIFTFMKIRNEEKIVKNIFSQAIVLNGYPFPQWLCWRYSNSKESTDETPKSSQVTSSSRVKSSNKDSGKTNGLVLKSGSLLVKYWIFKELRK